MTVQPSMRYRRLTARRRALVIAQGLIADRRNADADTFNVRGDDLDLLREAMSDLQVELRVKVARMDGLRAYPE